jgi:hypothetical protein
MTELRFTKDGIPIYDGSAELYIPFRRAALNYVETLEWKKRPLAGPRLQAALKGSARIAVQHKPPGWISHEGGAAQLLDFLKSRVQAPTLAEAGKTISKFFYQVKRRRGESMNAWIVRHDEALYEARRTLAEAIQEYAPVHSVGESSSVRASLKKVATSSMAASWQGSRRDDFSPVRGDSPFDDNGRMRDDEGEGADWEDHESTPAAPQESWQNTWWSQQQWWQWDRDRDDSWSRHQWRQPNETPSLKYGVSSQASAEADKFLPDFVVAWMLLQRSNLDGAERATIISSLKNEFTTSRVTEALRLNWPEDDLKRRDQSRGSALLVDDHDDILLHDEELDEVPEDLEDEARQEYIHLTREIESAHQAIQHHRRTLKEARERQTFMRKSRQFYPARRETNVKWKSDHEPKCFRCGGNHTTANCPQKDKNSKPASANVGQEVHFTFVTEPEAMENKPEVPTQDAFSLHSLVNAGKAIIDGGATASVGSADALDQVQRINKELGKKRDVTLDFNSSPSFRFGNNGKTQCLSTAQLEVPLAEKTGKMKIHVHDIPQQPVLLSIAALRSLGAVIDFSDDTCILKHIDASRVIQLERATSGHQVFPLTQDIFQNSKQRHTSFVSLFDSSSE